MNLPKCITDLLAAQANFDSAAYAACFAETAVVTDEGQTHKGRAGIKAWNEKTNAQYHTKLEPLSYHTDGRTGALKVKVSGTFDGSPLLLQYHFELDETQLLGLKITG